MLLIVVKHPVRTAYADERPTVVEEFTAAARAEPGNVCFDWYRAPAQEYSAPATTKFMRCHHP